MPGSAGQGTEEEAYAEQHQDPARPRNRVEALIHTLSQYQDVYPVLQRGIQFLCQEISDGIAAGEVDQELNGCIDSFIATGALVGTVNAMLANLDSPAFIVSCFELLRGMLNIAEDIVASAILKTDILIILDKIVHKVMYQNEPACVRCGINILAKLAKNLNRVESGLWTQLVATTAQAMLTDSLDNGLELDCLLTLKLLFQLRADIGVPATSANVILKTIDQCNHQLDGVSNAFASAAVAVIFRIVDSGGSSAARAPHLGFSVPVLAATLYQYQLKMELDDTHRTCVEKLIRAPLQSAVQSSLTCLINLALPPDESRTEVQVNAFQNAAMTLLLSVVWREEARAFLDSGGIAVIANVFVGESALGNPTIETAAAQALYYVSMHWPDETWNEVQANGTGVTKWIEVIHERCEDGNDELIHHLLATVKTLLHCEGFSEKFTESNGAAIFVSVLSKRQELPLSVHVVVTTLMSAPGVCQPDSLPSFCYLVAESMLDLESKHSYQLECAMALTRLIARQSPDQPLLSNQHVRDIVRVMRAKLSECAFLGEMFSLVANALLNDSIRAAFIDRALLQVVSKAICSYQWGSEESPGLNARLIICDVAHKLDVTRNLGTIEPQAHVSNGQSFSTQAISGLSTEALDTCCSVVGALAIVKPFLPLLIEEGSIQRITGMLRYAKQELILRSEASFVQLVTTCFYALQNMVTAPAVAQVVEKSIAEGSHDGVDGRAVCSQLLQSGADDAIIGCLEDALHVKKCPALLVDGGCQVLQAMLAFPMPMSSEVESRWIAVATSILQRNSTQQRTRKLLFATTLMVLSRGKQSVKTAGGQHIKMMKVILDGLEESIQHESCCTLLQGECVGAIRILEEIAKVSDFMSDALVSKCLGVLGKLTGIFILSPSSTAQENVAHFDTAIALFATTSYVSRLIHRLERCVVCKNGVIDCATMTNSTGDFKALEAILFSSQVRKTVDAYHRIFGYLAAVVENFGVHVEEMGEYASFFLELGCLSSQLLPTEQREEVINTALCQFAESTAWHSMRWIAALADRGSGEFTLVIEFVLLRIVSGLTVLDPALLMELFDALNYLLRCNQCREIVLASSHISELESVLWQLVQSDVAHLETEADGYDVAVSVLGIISTLLSSFSDNVFSIHREENGSDVLVRLCLGTLNSFFSDTNVGLTKSALLEEVLQTTGVILQHCIKLGAEHVRHITQHRATRHVVASSTCAVATHRRPCQTWCAVVLGAVIEHHGLLYAEKIVQLSSDPLALLISLVDIVIEDKEALSWKNLIECVGMVNGAKGWQLDCNGLFEKLHQQSKRLVHSQTTVANARRIKKHITASSACLSLEFGQLTTDASTIDSGCCLKELAQSGSAFYELFNAAPSFETSEYSTIVSLHLKIARVVGLKTDAERAAVEDSAVSLRQLLDPIGIPDEALADYIDLAVAVYLSPSIRAAAWQFVDACANVLSNAMQRLATGLHRSQCLETSLRNCVSALRTVYAARWESGEVESVLELLKVFSPHKWSQELLLESILVLPQGLLHLFELARAAPSNDIHVPTLMFLFDHVNDIRHKTQRIESGELTAILAIVKQNIAGKVGDTGQRGWRQVSGSEMLRAALETLKLFTKRKNCAILCSDIGGIDILHNVLCAPSQYADVICIALEIVCYLAGYGANLEHENTKFALQLLFLYVETSERSFSTRLAYLVLEYFLAVDPSKLNMSLIQQCRTQIIPASARSEGETEMFVLQLYITRQKIISTVSKPRYTAATTSVANESDTQMPLSENEILKIISSNCRRVVQVSSEPDESMYVGVNTSEKTSIEPLVYTHMREAVNQLSRVLDDPDMVSNTRYVSDLVPFLCEILALHTITTPMIYQVMQMLDQITFVHPSVVCSNGQLDIPALLASCSLHQRLSLPFARCLARFCSNIAIEGVTPTEAGFEKFEPLLDLLFELLQNWKLDEEIVDGCLSTLRILNDAIGIQCFHSVGSRDSLAVLNTSVVPYIGSSSTAWNWLKCVSTLLCDSDDLVHESIEATTTIVVGIIRMFMSHNFMVRKALTILACIYQEKQHLPLQHLVDSEGVDVLLVCLKLHANDGWIGRSCLGLLLDIASQNASFLTNIDQLVAANAAESILLVCKKNADNATICNMCIEFVSRMLGVFEYQPGGKEHTLILLGDRSRKKSELLAHLHDADIIPLLFDLLDNYSCRGDSGVLQSCLSLLKTLTKDERLCESAEILHGLQELQQTIDRIWETNFDCVLVELAVDCLVNMACSDRAIGHGWRDLPLWLLELADSIHKLRRTSPGMSVEKLVGILGRLAVDGAICKTISPKGSFTILELLDSVGDDRSLEQALYALLCTLSEDIECAQILIVYDAIPITSDRILSHIKDESTLLNSLCFFDLLVLNVGESYPALQDECVFEALQLVTQEYPETSGGHIYRIASTILEKVSALDYQKQRIKSVQAKPTPSSSPQLHIPDSEKAFYDLLVSGGKFRVLWEARPDTVESIQIKLAPSGDYLLFRRKETSHAPRIERVFASQLEVCPQRSHVTEARSPSSPSKKLLARSVLKENFEGDRVLRLKIRGEDVLVKTTNTRERVHWDQALQWLVSRRDDPPS